MASKLLPQRSSLTFQWAMSPAAPSPYDNQVFESLGATPRTYVWTWGSGPTADSFPLDIGVPEPSGILLLALPLGVVGRLTQRRRRPALQPA